MSNYSNNNINNDEECSNNTCTKYRKKYGNMTTSTPRQNLDNTTADDTFVTSSNQSRQRYSWEDTDYFIEHYDAQNNNASLTPKRLFPKDVSTEDETYNSQFSRISSPGLVPYPELSYETNNPYPNHPSRISPQVDTQNRDTSQFSYLSTFDESTLRNMPQVDDSQFSRYYAPDSIPSTHTNSPGNRTYNYDPDPFTQIYSPSSTQYKCLPPGSPEDESFYTLNHPQSTPLTQLDSPVKRANPYQRKYDKIVSSPKNKPKKDKDKDDINTKVNSINMLSVVISTVMLLAADVSDIPANYVDWSTKYLKCIKNMQGQHPANVKKVLNMLSMKKDGTVIDSTGKKCKCPHKDVSKRYK